MGQSAIAQGLIPSQPVAGMQAWYDAAHTSDLTIVSNKVSVWADRSGNGYDLSQGTSGNRPLYNSSPRTMNGITIPEFTGSERMDSSCPADDRTCTTFMAGLPDNFGSSRTPYGDSGGGGIEVRLSERTTSVLKSGVAFLATLPGPSAGFAFIHCLRLDTSTHEVLSLGAHGSASDSTTFTSGKTLRIGMDTSTTVVWDGLIAEFIRYSTVLSDADVKKTLLYLAQKWL